jgi:hypothetical protein
MMNLLKRYCFLPAALCFLLIPDLVLPAMEQPVDNPRVSILVDSFTPDTIQRARVIRNALEQAGLQAVPISGEALCDSKVQDGRDFDCLVLPDASVFPAEGVTSLLEFLRSGGDLVVVGGPAFAKLLYSVDGQWHTKEEILRSIPPEKTVLNLSKMKRDAWQRTTSHPGVEGKLDVARRDSQEEVWAEFFTSDLPGWDTYRITLPTSAFPEKDGVVCFEASGDKNTPSMSLEIQERDGSRWIAVIPLGERRQRYALALDEFRFWQDSESRGRGGRDDRLNLSNAESLTIGLARSHNALPSKGPHSFRISSIGWAKSRILTEASIPVLETLHPWYKTYAAKTIDRLQAVHGTFGLPNQSLLIGKTDMICPVWRSRGLCLQTGSRYRWIPLLNGCEGSRFRGTVASLLLNHEGEYANSHWLQVGIESTAPIEKLHGVLGPFMAQTIRKMSNNTFLRNGGVDRFSYFTGESVTIGCTLSSPAAASWRAKLQVRRRGGAGSNRLVFDKTTSVSGKSEVSLSWQPPSDEGVGYQATVELLDDRDRVVDRLTQDFCVLGDTPAPREEIVRAVGSDFVLKGKRWYPHGMNYWPSNWGGREPGEFWQHWLSAALYDPVVVERDLALVRELGMNSVSIQLNAAEHIPQANDFLFRCRKHGIYVNVFIGGAHPLQPNYRAVSSLLTEGKFAGNPAIYAYDIAWEPHLGEEGQRRGYDGDWKKWIEEQYGGIENAEEDWGFALREENGGITGPTQGQILTPGGWNVMVAGYRRFLDDLINRGYREVTRRIREIDPTHLIGVRSGYGGTGEMGIDFRMPFDLVSGAKHLDFISPEGYGLPANWERARATGLTTLYARYAGNGRPVFWAEFGQSVHPAYDEAAFTRQRSIYESMYRLVLDSYAQGSAGWWFPGGYRLGENSDYGVISLDMSPRGAAEEIHRFAATITAERPVPRPAAWITIDRDLHPRGFSQIRKRHEAEYLRLRESGKVVGLRTAGTGTTSATVPDVAVGNVPYTGKNPHKYLNAEINRVKLVLRNGTKIDLKDGQSVPIEKGQPIQLEVSVGNTGEPTWIAWRGKLLRRGDVYLSCSINGETTKRFPIRQNVGRFEDYEFQRLAVATALLSPLHLMLRVEASQKGGFGETFQVSLNPR